MYHLLDTLTYLDNSKIFTGIMMVMLNIGSRFVTIQLNKSCEQYIKENITKQILIFSMAWMATRHTITAILITILFVIVTDYLFNHDSSCCIVTNNHRVQINDKISQSEINNKVSEEEITSATAILEKAKKQQQEMEQKMHYISFYHQI